jgi:hypothetical protein
MREDMPAEGLERAVVRKVAIELVVRPDIERGFALMPLPDGVFV